MAKRGNKGDAAVSENGAAPSETEKISQRMAAEQDQKAAAAAAAKAAGNLDVRELTDLEAATGRAILAEKQTLDEKKKVLQLQDQLIKVQDQLLKAQQTNLQLRTASFNTTVEEKDKERVDFLRGLGVQDGDKADLNGGRLVITRAGQPQ